MLRKILLGTFLCCISSSMVIAAEEIPNYEIQEDGTVYKKYAAMPVARAYLKDKDLNKRIAGAKVICEIAHYEPNKGYDIHTGYGLLINSDDQVIYKMGVEAIKRFMTNEPYFSSNHFNIYFDDTFRKPPLGRGFEKWLQLYKDMGDDKNLRLNLREILADRLRFLQRQHEMKLEHGGYTYLDMPLREIKQIAAQEIEQANALADKIINNPS